MDAQFFSYLVMITLPDKVQGKFEITDNVTVHTMTWGGERGLATKRHTVFIYGQGAHTRNKAHFTWIHAWLP